MTLVSDCDPCMDQRLTVARITESNIWNKDTRIKLIIEASLRPSIFFFKIIIWV